VYVAMTSENELARIDGTTLAVTTTKVGTAPSVAASIPGEDGAIVLDSQNGTATIVRPSPTGDTVEVLPTQPNLNSLNVDPTGHYAIAWFDLAKAVQDGGALSGFGNFQGVTAIALSPGSETAVDLTVGFQPSAVEFDAAGSRAFVITQDGISVVSLADATSNPSTIVPPIAVADPMVSPDQLVVHVVATGEYAVVGQAGVASVNVVDLASNPGQTYTIALGSPATDIELSSDGTRVYAVARDAQQLAVIDIPADLLDPSGVVTVDLSDGPCGLLALSPDGTRGLLYTNATLDPRITMVALDQPGYPHVTWALEKAIRAVGIAPTSDTALLLDAKAPGDPTTATTLGDYIAESYGFTLLDLASGFSTLQLTPVDPGPFAYSGDGNKLYVALDGGDAATATRALEIVQAHAGVVTPVALGSPPSDVGILPAAGQAFVAQRHPLGRISFFAIPNDAERTVTGFDLNSQIVH
jgi:hypothetical protein